MIRGTFIVVSATYFAAVSLVGIATAKGPWMKKTKDMGLPAQNCMYCHTEKMPKKETFKADQLNERGKWLMSEKDKRKAAAVDPEWLKDYPGPKEQK
jgi:hypothetical protein